MNQAAKTLSDICEKYGLDEAHVRSELAKPDGVIIAPVEFAYELCDLPRTEDSDDLTERYPS